MEKTCADHRFSSRYVFLHGQTLSNLAYRSLINIPHRYTHTHTQSSLQSVTVFAFCLFSLTWLTTFQNLSNNNMVTHKAALASCKKQLNLALSTKKKGNSIFVQFESNVSRPAIAKTSVLYKIHRSLSYREHVHTHGSDARLRLSWSLGQRSRNDWWCVVAGIPRVFLLMNVD